MSARASAPTPVVVGIIPARLGSTRLPGKVLLERTGKPLVRHVWESARRAPSLSRLVIAADDARVRDAALAFGAECVLTSPDHPNGTSRLGEAADLLGLGDDALVVNVQGDEPEIDPGVIDAGVRALLDADAGRDGAARTPMATVGSPFFPGEDPAHAAIVKVVRRRDGRALYFSRALIPHAREGGVAVAPLKHVGLYVYRRWFLRTYGALPAGDLERCEVLEQLRVLEAGYDIAVAVHPARSGGIDTPEQYEAFVRRVREGEASA